MDVDNLIDFKKDFEHKLKLAGFGYINDITYLKDGITYIMKSKKDLKYYYSHPDKYKNIKILKKFKLRYDDNKYASFNLVSLEYVNNKGYAVDRSTKIINYVFKYILKSDSYDTITDDNQKRHFLKYNALFWLTGVRKFSISRKLSNLLDVFDRVVNDNKRRFFFFDTFDDVVSFLSSNNLAKASFDRLFLSDDDVLTSLFDKYRYNLLDVYTALAVAVSDVHKQFRFSSYDLTYYYDGLKNS
jgi:hypothetical protein